LSITAICWEKSRSPLLMQKWSTPIISWAKIQVSILCSSKPVSRCHLLPITLFNFRISSLDCKFRAIFIICWRLSSYFSISALVNCPFLRKNPLESTTTKLRCYQWDLSWLFCTHSLWYLAISSCQRVTLSWFYHWVFSNILSIYG